MRLFLLAGTPLSRLTVLSPEPVSGDVVAYIRDAQAPDESDIERLRNGGIEVVAAETLIPPADGIAIDNFVDDFVDKWYRRNRTAVGVSGPFSLGDLIAVWVNILVQPGFLIRFGEIFRALLKAYPGVTDLSTDLRDGGHPLMEVRPKGFPVFSLIEDLAREAGVRISKLETPSIPSYYGRNEDFRAMSFWPLLKSFVGGFRSEFLGPRLKTAFRRDSRPTAYFFLNHGIVNTARSLAENGSVATFADQAGHGGLVPLRFDHFLPLPSLGLLWAAWRLRTWSRSGAVRDMIFRGHDYGPRLMESLSFQISPLLLASAIKISQVCRLVRRTAPRAIVINGTFSPQARALIALQKQADFRLIYIDHGLNSLPYGFRSNRADYPSVTFIVPGEAHKNLYARSLPEPQKPRRVVLPIPVTSQVQLARGRRPATRAKRVLILPYSARVTDTQMHAQYTDRYHLDILRAIRSLKGEGITGVLRPKGFMSQTYLEHMIELADVSDCVTIERDGDLSAALMTCDLMISTNSTAYYQALYAGWPTVYYHPDFVRKDYIGLLADETAGAPVAQTPRELTEKIRQAYDPESPVARFPTKFNTELSERFLGPHPERTDEQLTAFLEKEIEATSMDRCGDRP